MCEFSRFEGNGNYNFSTGTKYEGELKDGCFHGKGTLLFENGAKYVADWIEGIASDVYCNLKRKPSTYFDNLKIKLFILKRENTCLLMDLNMPIKTGNTAMVMIEDFIQRFVMA